MTERTGYQIRHLDHTADIGLEVLAPRLDSLFQGAAEGLIGLFVDPETVDQVDSLTVVVEAADTETLLFRWLNEILYLVDSRSFIPRHVPRPRCIEAAGGWRLEAMIQGEQFDLTRHHIRTYVKAATYHHLHVGQSGDIWQATVFFDV